MVSCRAVANGLSESHDPYCPSRTTRRAIGLLRASRWRITCASPPQHCRRQHQARLGRCSSSLRGYVIHYGPSADSFNASVGVGNITLANVPNLTEGNHHFAVAATMRHTEGALSNDAAATSPHHAGGELNAGNIRHRAACSTTINSSTAHHELRLTRLATARPAPSRGPVKTYSNAGTYIMALTVTGPAGSNTTPSRTTSRSPPARTRRRQHIPGTPTATAASSTAIN